jgi:hypothetical protein
MALPADFKVPTVAEYDEIESVREWDDARLDAYIAMCEDRHNVIREAIHGEGDDDPALRRMGGINALVLGPLYRERERRQGS